MTTENHEHPYRALIEEWVKDTRQPLLYKLPTWDNWETWAGRIGEPGSFDPPYAWKLEPFDRHAEMRAKFKAHPWGYRWRCRPSVATTWPEWICPEAQHAPSWFPALDYEIEELPHWELRKQLAKEPGKWSVEVSTLETDNWIFANNPPEWCSGLKYRLVPKHKPRYIIDQDGVRYDLPEPMREAPSVQFEYWYCCGHDDVCREHWENDPFDTELLKRGRCFYTSEDAEAATRIWTAIFGGPVEEQK